MILTVFVKPNAKETKITGWRDAGTVIIRIKEPPTDGKANAALIAFLAKKLGIAKSLISIKRGAGSKVKHIKLPKGVDVSKLT